MGGTLGEDLVDERAVVCEYNLFDEGGMDLRWGEGSTDMVVEGLD